ncbi:CBS domain-containing protein [Inquilinus limosus]|uniref:CBS domain-containing protein n=1 Tax=Inquilinus limosus TaxID=171674 RepID=UPI003F16B775
MNVARILNVKGNSVIHIAPNLRLAEAVTLLRDKRIGAVVVSGDGRRIDGILSERDVVHRIADRGPSVLDEPVSAIMVRPVITCGLDDTVAELMGLMTQRRFRHLPVVDDQGLLCGMISIGDVVKARLDEIESEAESLREYIATG